MSQAYILTGHLESAQSLALDEPLPLTHGKVRVTVEPLSESSERSASRVLEEIWLANAKAGHLPPTKQEIDDYVDAERRSWE